VIATAAVLYELGGEEMMSGARKPEIVADAAHAIPDAAGPAVDRQVLLG
jgi:hypothetical protein